jgi:hypothetical protein
MQKLCVRGGFHVNRLLQLAEARRGAKAKREARAERETLLGCSLKVQMKLLSFSQAHIEVEITPIDRPRVVLVAQGGYAKEAAKNIALNVDSCRQVARSDAEDKSSPQHGNPVRRNTSDSSVDSAQRPHDLDVGSRVDAVMLGELVLDRQMIVVVLGNYPQVALTAFEKAVEEVNGKVSMLEDTLDQIVEMASELTKTEVLPTSRFDSLNVLSPKESREPSDSRKIVEVREEMILIVDRGFLREARFTCVGNLRLEGLIEAAHQSIVQFSPIFSLRFGEDLDKRLLKAACVFGRQSIVLGDSLFGAALLENVENLSHVAANDEVSALSVYLDLTAISGVIVANAIPKILEKLLEVKQKTLLSTSDFHDFGIAGE